MQDQYNASGTERNSKRVGKNAYAGTPDQTEKPKRKSGGDDGWERGEDGKKLKNPNNIRLALRLLGTTFRYDSFSERYYIDGLSNYGPLLNDDALNELHIMMQDECFFKPSVDDLFRLAKSEARQNSFDPVCDYLDECERKWDGVERIDEWLHAYMGARNSELNSAFGAKHLIAAVRRARQPGCKYDTMLVLEGDQRSGKSSCIRMLCSTEDLFTDALLIGAPIKEVREATQGKWLVELAELDGMSKRDASTVKAMLSRQCDNARMAYERLPDEKKRRFVMWGTCNDSHYLRDATGNRRFWPVHVENDDPTEAITSIIRDRDQLWGEAAAREAKGESLELPDSLRTTAREAQEERLEDDPWEDIIRRYVDGKEWIETSDLFEPNVLDIPKERQSTPVAKRVASIFTRLGWERKRMRVDRSQRWGYAPK